MTRPPLFPLLVPLQYLHDEHTGPSIQAPDRPPSSPPDSLPPVFFDTPTKILSSPRPPPQPVVQEAPETQPAEHLAEQRQNAIEQQAHRGQDLEERFLRKSMLRI